MFFKKKKKDIEEILELKEEAVVEAPQEDLIPEVEEQKTDQNIEIVTIEETQENFVEEIILENIPEEEIKPEEIKPEDFSQNLNDKPIYILGENALAVYLAIKFINSGEKVVIIPSKDNASTFSNNGITLIENHNLQKAHHKFDTTFWLKETPKMLIITSEANKINAAITSISRKKILNIPVVLFTPIRDILYIKNILENDVYRAFFDGYLSKKPNQVNLYGRAPNITICTKDKELKDKKIIDAFEKAGLTTTTEENENYAFWDFFTVYTACSLISAAHNKNIFDVIKDKDKRDKMIPLIAELCKIAKKDGATLNQEEFLKKLYNTPLSYPYPLQVELAQGRAGDIDLISSNIVNIARKYKVKTPETNALLKKIYNIILA